MQLAQYQQLVAVLTEWGYTTWQVCAQVLGVARDASQVRLTPTHRLLALPSHVAAPQLVVLAQAEVKKAYRTLALRCHPDKCPGDEARGALICSYGLSACVACLVCMLTKLGAGGPALRSSPCRLRPSPFLAPTVAGRVADRQGQLPVAAAHLRRPGRPREVRMPCLARTSFCYPLVSPALDQWPRGCTGLSALL